MKILTDTHTLVWALAGSPLLGSGARDELSRSPFTASVANLWELVVKSRKPGALLTDPVAWWEMYVVRQRIPALPIRARHVRELAALPDVHRDPFDRILVAQARVEGLTIASRDSIIGKYGVPVIWD